MNDAAHWVGEHVSVGGPMELVHDKPWSRVWQVPLAPGGAAWFKECAPVQAFEPRLTYALGRRWPDRIVGVLGHDVERAWLLLADGGTPVGAFGNAADAWAAALPLYAELQRGEVEHVQEHLGGGVPDRRLALLPGLYEDMVARTLPLDDEELEALRRAAPGFARLCAELAAYEIPETIQHDDLHIGNVYAKEGRMLLLDWGDACIAHPFLSLARADDDWDDRLREAYLEPWGRDLDGALDLALQVGAFAYAFGFLRVWDHFDEAQRDAYRDALPQILRRAYERVRLFSSTRTRRGFDPS